MNCPYCERRCNLAEKRTGFCKMYHEITGEVQERYPSRWSSYFVTHIESAPFFHAFPGARTMMTGTAGCNLACRYCANAYIARTDPAQVELFEIPPEHLVSIARKAGCHTIVFGLNEPTVSMPSFLALAECAADAGIATGCLTNGYMTEECAHKMADSVSFVNISIKSMSSDFYHEYADVSSVNPVLRNIKILADNCHVEVTTPLLPSVNGHEIRQIAKFIGGIDASIPWHVFRLLPEHQMASERPPDIREIDTMLDEAREILPFVYFSNFIGSDRLNTICPECGRVLVSRINPGGCGGKTVRYLIEDGKCPFCGEEIPITGERASWNGKTEEYP